MITVPNHSPRVRRFLSDDAGLSEVGFGSSVSTDEIIGGIGDECGLAEDGTCGSAPDSKGCSDVAGEGGYNILPTRGKGEWTRYIPHRS